MNWSTVSGEDALSELARAISAQIERAREALDAGANLASSVHEARRAIKRARALLKLADPGSKGARSDIALRDASRVLAVLRDADVRVQTAEDLREGSGFSEPTPVPPRLLESLEEERDRCFAESGSAAGPLRTAGELIGSVATEITAPDVFGSPGAGKATESGGLELLRLGLGASYMSVRVRSDPALGQEPVDERAHKLRKRVKDLRYQLEFLDNGHSKLGRLVRDLHHLTDLLGDANDLATLSSHTAAAAILCETERAAFSAHVEESKQLLRSEAAGLSARLFEEEPDSFVRRIEGWITLGQG